MSGYENGQTAITTLAGETETITMGTVVSTISTTTTIPLTTVFTPPASCSHHWTYEAQMYNGNPGTMLLQNAVDVDQDCFPSPMYASGRAWFLQVYSPGACPSGWTTPAILQDNGTTTAICCESNFSYLTTVSTNNWDGGTLLFHGCLSSYTSSTFVGSRSGSLVPGSVSVGPGTLWGQPLTMLYQEKDLTHFAKFPSTSAKPSAGSTSIVPSPTNPAALATASRSSTPQNTPSPTSIPSTSHASAISSAAAAGIGIGGGLGILLLALATFLLWRHRSRRRRQRLDSTTATASPPHPGIAELGGKPISITNLPPAPPPSPKELEGARLHELYGSYASRKTGVEGVQRSYEKEAEPGELPA
ncbi:MAG: hypothetical protein M1821_007523 [Bathelium mastoideum]|nr:MAG: hypothetical protein M1821_007523 [Bathelium mastoideum]